MMNWSGGMGAAGWVFMSIAWVLLIAAIVWAVAALSGRTGHTSGATTTDRPEEILDRRLASGEIDSDTYEALRAKLRAAHAQRI